MSTATRMHVMEMNLHDKGLQSTSFTSNHSPLVANYEGILRGGHFPARINPLNLVRVQNQQSFSKYKQLKKYNDSLMKMQQEMHYQQQTMKDGKTSPISGISEEGGSTHRDGEFPQAEFNNDTFFVSP